FHQLHQPRQALAAHDAVGVKHHHIAVTGSPTAAEVVDVAALAFHTPPTATVEDLAEAAHRAAQLDPRTLFGHAGIGVVAVAQNEEIKMLELAAARNRFVRGAQAGKHPGHVLVADWHDDGRPGFRRDRLVTG